VLEYFDASLIGLTATPSKQTFGFFQQNLVMEYNHENAVADGVNVGCDIYRIKTQITQGGSKVEAGFFVDKRDRQTRKVRWEQLDEVLAYDAADLDRDVVATDQIRTVLTTFRDRVFTEMFPGRTDLPKTLIFAKDDTHADDIVRICREVFGKGNDFCQKITYRTGFVRIVEKKPQPDGSELEEITWKRASSLSPDEILSAFRNSYNPRIAVTVDMIATGTDITASRGSAISRRGAYSQRPAASRDNPLEIDSSPPMRSGPTGSLVLNRVRLTGRLRLQKVSPLRSFAPPAKQQR
jgi:type I restriction enzyme R subunit